MWKNEKHPFAQIQRTFQFSYFVRDREPLSLGLDERDFLVGISVCAQTFVWTLK